MLEHHDIAVCFGRRGWGKTTISKQLQADQKRVVVLDRLREYTHDPRASHVVTNFEDFARACLECEKRDSFKIIYQFEIENDETEFNEAMRVVYYMGDTCLVIEEIHHFASVHQMPSMLRECILTGRHQRILLILTTQRPGELHKTILSQASHIFAGSVHESNDTLYLSKIMGDVAFELKALKKTATYSEFIHYRPGEEPEKIQVQLKY